MLKKEHNDLLAQTGPGTPMGELFRRYWTPALLAEELPENDCPPVGVKLLSERLLAFRHSRGRYGLIDEFAKRNWKPVEDPGSFGPASRKRVPGCLQIPSSQFC
jgi:hypothetical protein